MGRDGSCPIELVWERKESCLSENLYLKCQVSILMVPAQSNPMVGRMGHYDGAGLDLMSVLEARRGHGPGTGSSSSGKERGGHTLE